MYPSLSLSLYIPSVSFLSRFSFSVCRLSHVTSGVGRAIGLVRQSAPSARPARRDSFRLSRPGSLYPQCVIDRCESRVKPSGFNSRSAQPASVVGAPVLPGKDVHTGELHCSDSAQWGWCSDEAWCRFMSSRLSLSLSLASPDRHVVPWVTLCPRSLSFFSPSLHSSWSLRRSFGYFEPSLSLSFASSLLVVTSFAFGVLCTLLLSFCRLSRVSLSLSWLCRSDERSVCVLMPRVCSNANVSRLVFLAHAASRCPK